MYILCSWQDIVLHKVHFSIWSCCFEPLTGETTLKNTARCFSFNSMHNDRSDTEKKIVDDHTCFWNATACRETVMLRLSTDPFSTCSWQACWRVACVDHDGKPPPHTHTTRRWRHNSTGARCRVCFDRKYVRHDTFPPFAGFPGVMTSDAVYAYALRKIFSGQIYGAGVNVFSSLVLAR